MNLPRFKNGMTEAERQIVFNNAMADIERGFASTGRVMTDLRKELAMAKRRT